MNNHNLQELKESIKEKDLYSVRTILRDLEPQELDKETLSLAINSNHPSIVSTVAAKSPRENFDQNTLNEAINTRSSDIFRSISSKTPKQFFDKKNLLDSINTNISNISQTVINQTTPEHFDKNIIDAAIKTNKKNIIKAVISKTPQVHFDKKMLKDAIQMPDTDVADMIIRKSDNKLFDQETLDMAIDTNKPYIIRSVCNKTPENHFTKDLLNQALNTFKPEVGQIIVDKTPPSLFDKQLLNEIIGRTPSSLTVAVARKAPKELFDGETLQKALETNHAQTIKAVAEKTDKQYFNEEILKKLIDTKLDNVIDNVLKKIDPKLINKEIMRLSIETKKGNLVETVAKYSDPKIFDKDTLESALKTNDADVVRAIVDRTTDRNLFFDYKEQIQKNILKAKDISNLTAQILSRSDNESFDREMQELVVDIYLDVIKDHFKKSNMPKDFPIKEFENSIKESRYFFSNPKATNFDSLEKDNRFLVQPIYSYGHCFSAVTRKLEEDKYSITFVNLGARPFERTGKGNQYKEFVYTKDEATKVLKDHSLIVRLEYPDKVVDTNKAYENFAKNALEQYTLNVTSRDQKVGNCFLKNIEKGIRYALSLGLSKTENKEFDPNSLRVSVEGEGKYKVKFLKPVHKTGDKTNELTTLELRRDLVNALIKKFPEFETHINREWEVYEKRKTPRPEPTPTPKPEPLPVPTPVFDKNRIAGYNIATPNKVVKAETNKNRDFELINKMEAFANKNNTKSKSQDMALCK